MLKKFDIPVVKDMKGVGQNLQDHLQIRTVYEVNLPTLNTRINSFIGRMMMGMFATPVGDDELTSTLEVTGSGSVIANGQKIR